MTDKDTAREARETRIVEHTVSLIDYASRIVGALQRGNWHYAAEKLDGAKTALDGLDGDFNRTHTAELHQINGSRVWARVAPLAQSYWLGRAIAAWDSRDTAPPADPFEGAEPQAGDVCATPDGQTWWVVDDQEHELLYVDQHGLACPLPHVLRTHGEPAVIYRPGTVTQS